MRSPIALRLNSAFARWPGTKARRNQGGISSWWNWPQAGSEICNIITIGTCQYPAKGDRWQRRKPSNSNINSHHSVECFEGIKLTFAIAPKGKYTCSNLQPLSFRAIVCESQSSKSIATSFKVAVAGALVSKIMALNAAFCQYPSYWQIKIYLFNYSFCPIDRRSLKNALALPEAGFSPNRRQGFAT